MDDEMMKYKKIRSKRARHIVNTEAVSE